jgi:hypothetical protein
MADSIHLFFVMYWYEIRSIGVALGLVLGDWFRFCHFFQEAILGIVSLLKISVRSQGSTTVPVDAREKQFESTVG